MRAAALPLILALTALHPAAQAQGLPGTGPSVGDIVCKLRPDGCPDVDGRGIKVTPEPGVPPAINLTILFPTNSAALTPPAMVALDDLGRALTDPSLAPYRFRVEGHTDSVGGRDANRMLSGRRAAAAVDYLSGRFGISRSRLDAAGLGQDAPLVPTPPQTPEPRNRRVQVINLGR